MRILLTGGAGFIGSHLAERLLARGHEVVILDDLSTGSRAHLGDALNHPRLRFIEDKVEHHPKLAALVAEADLVVHLAAAVGVDLVVRSPVHTIQTNIHGSELLFTHAAAHGKRIILASTSEVYGKADSPSFSETDDLVIGPPTHFRWSYAASKALDEYLAFAFAKERGLRQTVVRFFNIVGPRQTGRYGMVLPRFVEQALAGNPVRVFGDGEQIRCFCHVADTVEALLQVMDREETVGEIFNIGSPEPVSINALAARVIALTGSRSSVVHIPYDQAYSPGFEDMLRRVPDIGKIGRVTGWKPQHALDDIIRDVVREFRRRAASDAD